MAGPSAPATTHADGDPLVSVIVVAYNAERFLGDALDSVFAQTYPRLECIVVDDGSTDATSEIAASYERVRLIREGAPSGSPGRSRNRGAGIAGGELLAFLDGDDAWMPERLERMVNRLMENSADAALCGTQIVDSSLNPTATIRMNLPFELERLLLWSTPADSTGSNLLIRHSAFTTLGGYDPRLAVTQDWLLLVRLIDSHKLAYVDAPLVMHRRHDTNLGRSIPTMEHDMLLAYDELFREWAERPELLALQDRAYANLHRMLAGSYFARSQPRGFLRNAALSLRRDPRTLAYFLGFPVRRVRAIRHTVKPRRAGDSSA